MIIHISGTSGSGKTTLGAEIKKKFKSKVIVIETDSFISHDTPDSKRLLKLEKSPKEYKKLWREIIKNAIDKCIEKYPNKTIIFTGLLNNWAIDDEPYKMHVSCTKYFLDVPLAEIIKRYYLRIYLTEQKVTKKQSDWYWNCVTEKKCFIRSSEQIIKNYENDMKWHKNNGYKISSANFIISHIQF